MFCSSGSRKTKTVVFVISKYNLLGKTTLLEEVNNSKPNNVLGINVRSIFSAMT